MILDDKPDYADLWINMQVEIRLMHNYLLQGRWDEAGDCAGKCEKISSHLIDWCEEMSAIEKAESSKK